MKARVEVTFLRSVAGLRQPPVHRVKALDAKQNHITTHVHRFVLHSGGLR